MSVLIGGEARQYRQHFRDFHSILDFDLEEDELLAVREMLQGMIAEIDARIEREFA